MEEYGDTSNMWTATGKCIREAAKEVVELRRIVDISENQFEFMPKSSTTKAIHLVRRLMGQYRERKRDLHIVFIDLENDYNKVLKEVLQRYLKARGVHVDYTKVIKDIYDRAKTRVRTLCTKLEHFPSYDGVASRINL
ncbi:uncharacterized protein [Nicotiana sylvestris]|uniref:uncharacterized protein n=1 Tax=Nicotiana sylvestris TaxID=4096 RepID=UPI00388CCF88